MDPKSLDLGRTSLEGSQRQGACASHQSAFLLSLLTISFAVPVIAQNTPAIESFGGDYSSLRPEQKRLIDDWFSRFSAIVKKPVDPVQAYEKLPLSAKTTFAAVTHALMMTPLTDEVGKALADQPSR
jgi:hypothetical protein